MCCTGYIPYHRETIHLKNATISGASTAYIAEYDVSKTFRQVISLTDTLLDDGNGVYTGQSTMTNGFIRISCGVIDDTTILTLDEEIS